MNYSEALKKFENIELNDCMDFFKENGYALEYAYSLLLSGYPAEAKKIADDNDSVRFDWLSKLISVCCGRVEYPTYFQLRSFLEIDLTALIKAKRIDYVNNILKMAQKFQGINSECYKFIGRCLLKNGYLNEAKIFFDRSLNYYYNDIELHYLYVEYFLTIGDFQNAKKSAKICLNINPDYYPAKKTYNELKTFKK